MTLYLIARIADCDKCGALAPAILFAALYLIARIADCDLQFGFFEILSLILYILLHA